MHDFAPDTFTENDVLRCLEQAGLEFKNGTRYILSQCPMPDHEDKHPSVQIYKDDWFINCHAGCGRHHITKAFPDLRPNHSDQEPSYSSRNARNSKAKSVSEHKYKQYDLMNWWKELPAIPRDHVFKNIPLEILDQLGWRWDAPKNSYFIPYFSATKTSIPFGQWRHLSGERRFTMLKDAKPTCYGTWNLDNSTIFVVEGTSDCAVLEYCAVPYVGLPSAASKELMQSLAGYCSKNGIQLVYAGDNDTAGDKLREALDEVSSYRVWQPPKKYKDWGEYLLAEGQEIVTDYCFKELIPNLPNYLSAVEEVFPGAQEMQIV